MQEPLKEEIKAWLKEQNHSREWLAKQTGVKKRTVDNWLSSPQEIPMDKASLIRRLMADDEAKEAQRRLQLLPTNQIFSLEVDLPTFRAYSAAALAAHKTLEQWAIAELNAAADTALPTTTKGAKSPQPQNITHISDSSHVKSSAEEERPRREATGTED